MEKVLIIVGDASETLDTMYPYYRLIESGFEPVVAAPEQRLYQMVLHEVKPGWTITKEWEGYTIEANIAFKDIKPEEYLGILYSGGRAPSTFAMTKISFASPSISSMQTSPLVAFVTASRFQLMRTAFVDAVWRRYPNAGSTWRSVVAPSSTSHVSSTAISSVDGRSMITVTT